MLAQNRQQALWREDLGFPLGKSYSSLPEADRDRGRMEAGAGPCGAAEALWAETHTVGRVCDPSHNLTLPGTDRSLPVRGGIVHMFVKH